MHGLRGAEAERGHVVAFEDVQHLRDVHAGGRGRRRAHDLPAAIIGADRLPLDGLVGFQIRMRDEAAIGLHVVDEHIAEQAVVQRVRAVLRDIAERLGIFRLHHALAGFQRRTLGQIDRRDRLVLQHHGRAVGDAFVQIRRHDIAARGVLDRGLHHIGKAHGAEPRQRLAPRLQRAGNGNGLRPVEVLVIDRVEHVMRRARFRCVSVGLHRQRHRALAVDEAMAAVGEADMRHAAADDADHHRLDHRERKQRGDRGVHRVAAGGEHFQPRAEASG